MIRESLHNCIAHQDYSKGGRIIVTENEDGVLTFTNLGAFIPGNVETFLSRNEPPEYYRNKFLTDAMLNLKMIDTIGSGIRRMYNIQKNKFFPMPDYETVDGRVQLQILGKILDIDYVRQLALSTKELTLSDIILLDRVQKHKPLTEKEVKVLREKKLIEGRMPFIHVSKTIAGRTGQKVEYTNNKAFEKQQYIDWILEGIKHHKFLERKDIDKLLIGRMSDLLTEKQKIRRISHYLTWLRTKEIIENAGTDKEPRWELKVK